VQTETDEQLPKLAENGGAVPADGHVFPLEIDVGQQLVDGGEESA
jgi:hypothetical protein